MIHERMLIGGKWVRSKNGDVIEVVNPAAGEVFAEYPLPVIGCGRCHKCGGFCFSSWSRMTPLKGENISERPVNWF